MPERRPERSAASSTQPVDPDRMLLDPLLPEPDPLLLTTLELKLADRSAFSVQAAQTAAGGGSRVARDGQRQRLTSA